MSSGLIVSGDCSFNLGCASGFAPCLYVLADRTLHMSSLLLKIQH